MIIKPFTIRYTVIGDNSYYPITNSFVSVFSIFTMWRDFVSPWVSKSFQHSNIKEKYSQTQVLHLYPLPSKAHGFTR